MEAALASPTTRNKNFLASDLQFPFLDQLQQSRGSDCCIKCLRNTTDGGCASLRLRPCKSFLLVVITDQLYTHLPRFKASFPNAVPAPVVLLVALGHAVQ